MRSCASLILAGALLGTTACDDDDKPPEEGQLSAAAEKGIEILPFELDLTGLTTSEKERIGVGSYLVNAVADCTTCHQTLSPSGPPTYLSGGVPFQISAAGDVVYARNLTPDPDTGMKLTEAEFIEAMRTGKDFRSEGAKEQLIVMPWYTFRWMSTEDLKSIYAYLQKVPAIRNPVPDDIKGAAAAAQPVPFPSTYNEGEVSRQLPGEANDERFITRGFAISPLADPPSLSSLSAEDRALYGRGSYLVNAVADCNGCHTNPQRDFSPSPTYLNIPTAQFLSGGNIFPTPPGLDAVVKVTRSMSGNLLGANHGAMADMSYEDFRNIITKGEVKRGEVTRPIGFPMSAVAEALRKMTEDDLRAVYTYVKHQTPRTGAADKQTQPPARYCAQDTDCNMDAGETCNTATKECVGNSCTGDEQCGACQTCSADRCVAPEATSTCLTGGI